MFIGGDRKIRLTLQQVSGNGTCLGKVSQVKWSLCTSIDNTPRWKDGPKWLIPENNGWWICSKTGLAACLSTSVFNASEEFCVLVTVMSSILYHPKECMYSHWNRGTSERPKREPITALTVATLFSSRVSSWGQDRHNLPGYSMSRNDIPEGVHRWGSRKNRDLHKSIRKISHLPVQGSTPE